LRFLCSLLKLSTLLIEALLRCCSSGLQARDLGKHELSLLGCGGGVAAGRGRGVGHDERERGERRRETTRGGRNEDPKPL
jgi:hypothetical protein